MLFLKNNTDFLILLKILVNIILMTEQKIDAFKGKIGKHAEKLSILSKVTQLTGALHWDLNLKHLIQNCFSE